MRAIGRRGRVSAARWRRLSQLLIDVERGMAAAARLDAHDIRLRRSVGRTRGTVRLNCQLTALEHQIDRELDRLTAERLTVDLAEKRARQVIGPTPWETTG